MSSPPSLLDGSHFVRCISLAGDEEKSLRKDANDRNYCFVGVDLAGIRTHADLTQRLAVALNFPAYFGRNWAALLGLMTDMSWEPAPGYVVLMKSADAILALRDDAFKKFVRVCAAAVSQWQSGETEDGQSVPPTPFYVILAGPPHFCRLLADLASSFQ